MYAKNAPVTEVKGLFSKLIKFIAPFMIRQDLRFVNRMYNLYNYTSRAVQQKQRDNLSRFSMQYECTTAIVTKGQSRAV